MALVVGKEVVLVEVGKEVDLVVVVVGKEVVLVLVCRTEVHMDCMALMV